MSRDLNIRGRNNRGPNCSRTAISRDKIRVLKRPKSEMSLGQTTKNDMTKGRNRAEKHLDKIYLDRNVHGQQRLAHNRPRELHVPVPIGPDTEMTQDRNDPGQKIPGVQTFLSRNALRLKSP